MNDRGPNLKGRDIDLSKKAAQSIGIDKQGVAPVITPTKSKATAVTFAVSARPLARDRRRQIAPISSGNRKRIVATAIATNPINAPRSSDSRRPGAALVFTIRQTTNQNAKISQTVGIRIAA